MDRLSHFFSRFSVNARVFFAGQLCGRSSDHATRTAGHLHVLRSGVLRILHEYGAPTVIDEPTVLLYPRPGEHTFQSDGADIVCALVDLGSGMVNPLAAALPRCLRVPLSSVPELAPTIDLLFAEAFEHKDGRQVAVDRLTEYFLVLLLRSALHANLIQQGQPLKMVAPSVGYASSGALIRSFARHTGMPPMTWLAAQQGERLR